MLFALWHGAVAQDDVVQNRPYTDLRPFHFGILVGTHLQDLEFVNAGPQVVTLEDGTQQTTDITADQDRWDNGFNAWRRRSTSAPATSVSTIGMSSRKKLRTRASSR